VIMTALTESSLRVLSNSSAYPHSAGIPNDGDDSDHDSVGMSQQRPTAGWGTAENLMDPVWSSRAFYGGPNGPNSGSARGLVDIDDWQSMDPGAAAQAVQSPRIRVGTPSTSRSPKRSSAPSAESRSPPSSTARDPPLTCPPTSRKRSWGP
jgi:hypothetical protein